jgi:hypothetical protein
MSNLFYNLGAKYGFGWHENHAKQVIKLCMQLYNQIAVLEMLLGASDIDTQVMRLLGLCMTSVTVRKPLGRVNIMSEARLLCEKNLAPWAVRKKMSG